MLTLRCAGLIAAKDLRLELRSRDLLASGGLFAVTVLVTVSFVLPASGAARRDTAAGMLWISLLFAVLLAVGRATALEHEDHALEGLLLSPAPREAIFLGKLVANLAVVGLVEVPLVTLFLLLSPTGGQGSTSGPAPAVLPAPPAVLPATVLSAPVLPAPVLLATVLLLATVGLVTVATLFSVVAEGSRLGTSMLPLLVLPVALPLVVAAVEATRLGLGGQLTDGGQPAAWLGLLAAFDVLVLVAGTVTFPYLVEE